MKMKKLKVKSQKNEENSEDEHPQNRRRLKEERLAITIDELNEDENEISEEKTGSEADG